MSIECADSNRGETGNSLTFILGDPFLHQRLHQAETKLQNRNEHDPEQAPKPKRGDIYILIGVFVGVTAGGLLGYFSGNLFVMAVAIIGGGIIGAVVGSLVKKRLTQAR